MSDIQVPATQQLTQALNQLSKLAPQSEAARLGIEVIVKHLAGSILNLSTPGSGLNRELSLPARNLQGQLQNAGTYTVKVAAQQNPVLQFFSSESPAQPIKIPITPQQLQVLLKLPANQILNMVPTQVQASNSQAKGDLPLLLNAKVESLVNRQLLVKVAGQNKALPIQLPPASPTQFKANEALKIEISPNGAKWQLKITNIPTAIANSAHPLSNKSSTSRLQTPLSSLSPSPSPTASPTQLPLSSNKPVDARIDGSLQKTVLATPKTHSLVISPEQAPALLKAALSVSIKGNTPSIQLPVQTILTQLPNKLSENVEGLLNKLNQLSTESVTLKATSTGQFELLGKNAKPVAQLPISRDILSVLAQVKVPNSNTQGAVDPSKLAAANLPPVPNSAAHAVLNPKSVANQTTTVNSGLPYVAVTPSSASVDGRLNPGNIPPESSLNKPAATVPNSSVLPPKTLNTPVSSEKNQYTANISAPQNTASKVSVESKTDILPSTSERATIAERSAIAVQSQAIPNKAEQIKLIQTLLRVVNARAELPAETLNRIQLAVTDPLLSKENSLKELIDPLVQQIKQAVPQGKENDAAQIRQLLSAPALNLTSVQLVAPPASQGMLGGLVALLQISLASRLLRNQPAQLDNITQTLGSLIGATNKAPSSAQAARGLANFFQLEQKHQLLKEIGRLLSGHQANKLTSAEQVIQGQDTFYYTLPSAFNDQLKDIELLIRRESESQQEDSKNDVDTKSWHLTMKLSVGELGELLTKAKLRPDHLEIDFYASNEATKEQVFNFLPLLKKRLVSLGIEVAKSQCQLGKIPSTLQQRPYQVFQTKV